MAATNALTVALAVALAALCGCSVSELAQPSLRIGVTGPMTHLDPARGTEAGSVIVSRYAFQTLPQIATAVRHSGDESTWTFTIPDGVIFSDATTLDAPAVAANFDRWRLGWFDADGYFGYATAFLDPKRPATALASVKALDRNTLQIRTRGAYADLPAVLAEPYFGIGSPTAFAVGNERFDRAPVGSGPYKIVTWDPGNDIVLEPAPHSGPGRYATVVVRDIVDAHTTVLATRKNDVDVTYGFPADLVNESLTYALRAAPDPVTGLYCAYSPLYPSSKRVCPPAASAHGPDAEPQAP